MSEIDLDELRSELSEYATQTSSEEISAKEQRIIAGFEEIERFVEAHDRLPQHGENCNIFERIYATRLDRLRADAECRAVLEGRDPRRLLELNETTVVSGSLHEVEGNYTMSPNETEPDDEDLLNALRAAGASASSIEELKYVRSHEEIRAAEEIAKRNVCRDFALFRPFFEKAQKELKSGVRRTLKFKDNAQVNKNDLFILDGQSILVADMEEKFITSFGRHDRRLRVIYDNGTESDLLLRSLQRALNKDKRSRRITEPDYGPLFGDEEASNDVPSGSIYVLRSKSEHPFVAQHRTILHKIGVTSGDVKTRIANAKKDATYLLADVEVVAVFELANINCKLLEALLHRFFQSARLDIEFKDRFGCDVAPREWFLLPLSAIEDAIEKLKEGSITHYKYDKNSASIVPAESNSL